MKRLIGLSVAFGLIFSASGFQELSTQEQVVLTGSKITPALQETAGLSRREEPLRVWVYLRDKGQIRPGDLVVARAALPVSALQRRSKVREAVNLVESEDIPPAPSYVAAVRARVAKVRTESRWLNAISVEASPGQIRALSDLDFVARLDIVRGFRRTEPVPEPAPEPTFGLSIPGPLPPHPPIYGPSYRQIDQINVRRLHERGLTGSGVRVCLLDTGFRKSHDVFRSARIIAERDFVLGDGDVQRNPADPKDYSDSHGTATWSLLGGYLPGLLIGPAFGAEFILGKTEDDRSETPVEEDYWVAGIEWAEALGAEVVSSSLGYTDWYQFKDMDGRTAVTTRAANRATSLGVVVVNAAGNERRNAWGRIIAPADGPDVIAVGAVDANGRIASFSSPGPTADGRIKPEVCAMGVKNFYAVSSPTSGEGSYWWGSGTSFATPLLGGVVALLLEAHPEWTPKQVREALTGTAGNTRTPNNDYGWGIIDARAAADFKPIR